MKTTTLLAALALACAAAPASAAFRCNDKAGKVVYMERPCATYGYVTEKEVKDPPKGDGTATVIRPGQALVGSPSDKREPGSQQIKVPLQCKGERVMCYPGDTVICGGKKRLCESS
jgi:hypothetical protein